MQPWLELPLLRQVCRASPETASTSTASAWQGKLGKEVWNKEGAPRKAGLVCLFVTKPHYIAHLGAVFQLLLKAKLGQSPVFPTLLRQLIATHIPLSDLCSHTFRNHRAPLWMLPLGYESNMRSEASPQGRGSSIYCTHTCIGGESHRKSTWAPTPTSSKCSSF